MLKYTYEIGRKPITITMHSIRDIIAWGFEHRWLRSRGVFVMRIKIKPMS